MSAGINTARRAYNSLTYKGPLKQTCATFFTTIFLLKQKLSEQVSPYIKYMKL